MPGEEEGEGLLEHLVEDTGGPGLLDLPATHHVPEEMSLSQEKGQILLRVRSSRSSCGASRGWEAAHGPELRGHHREPAGALQRGWALHLRASGGLGAVTSSSSPVLSIHDS